MIIDQDKNRWTYIFKGLGIIFMYFLVSLFKALPFALLNINVNNINDVAKNIYSFTLESVMIVIIYIVFEKEIKTAIKDIKTNHEKYFKENFKIYVIGIIIMMLSNILINKFGGGLSENESIIRQTFERFPVYTYISSVFLAPLLEEFIFRLGFRSVIKNNILYIILSGLIFGYLHLAGMKINILFPLYLLSYCSAGWAFAYIMTKTNNILVSSGLHFMHNGLIMSIQIFSLIFL